MDIYHLCSHAYWGITGDNVCTEDRLSPPPHTHTLSPDYFGFWRGVSRVTQRLDLHLPRSQKQGTSPLWFIRSGERDQCRKQTGWGESGWETSPELPLELKRSTDHLSRKSTAGLSKEEPRELPPVWGQTGQRQHSTSQMGTSQMGALGLSGSFHQGPGRVVQHNQGCQLKGAPSEPDAVISAFLRITDLILITAQVQSLPSSTTEKIKAQKC